MWNPDAVMRVDIGGETVDAQERFDKAAATQLVFEDALFHIIGHLIRTTGSSRLVLTGGTALNAIANMRLMDHFEGLHVWVPPVPGDAGVAVGAAYHFALVNGAPLGAQSASRIPLRRRADANREIEAALRMRTRSPGRSSATHLIGRDVERIADLLAWCVARDGVLGLFQGVAETGPRALGHRSILANPCNPGTLETINRLVKFREPFRPLAPMLTLEAAHRWFELQEGASDDDYNAYNYMVLTVRPRPETTCYIPAVIHRDGTSRIQIVREDTDPFTHAYLRAMGRRCGVEASVNTSLNVAGPIVQTPHQALQALRRSRAMDGVLLIAARGRRLARLARRDDTAQGWRPSFGSMDAGVAGNRRAGSGTNMIRVALAVVLLTVASAATAQVMPLTTWYWQLRGTIDASRPATIYDIDMADNEAALFAQLKSAGHIVICYFSAGTWEEWRSDAADFPASVKGAKVTGWAGENWLDIRSPIVRDLMSKRMDLAESKGCDGLEPDNVDGYANEFGFPVNQGRPDRLRSVPGGCRTSARDACRVEECRRSRGHACPGVRLCRCRGMFQIQRVCCLQSVHQTRQSGTGGRIQRILGKRVRAVPGHSGFRWLFTA